MMYLGRIYEFSTASSSQMSSNCSSIYCWSKTLSRTTAFFTIFTNMLIVRRILHFIWSITSVFSGVPRYADLHTQKSFLSWKIWLETVPRVRRTWTRSSENLTSLLYAMFIFKHMKNESNSISISWSSQFSKFFVKNCFNFNAALCNSLISMKYRWFKMMCLSFHTYGILK